MRTLLDLLNLSQAREDDEDFQGPIDLLFEELEKEKPTSFAVRQYKKYKQAAGETAKSILISCGARLAPFDIEELLGKETIGSHSESKSRGKQNSDGTNTQGMGRELMTLDELAVMPRSRCICQISGVRPFYSQKYDLLKHPRYRWLSDADRSNEYTPPWVQMNQPPSPDEFFLFDDAEPEAPEQSES